MYIVRQVWCCLKVLLHKERELQLERHSVIPRDQLVHLTCRRVALVRLLVRYTCQWVVARCFCFASRTAAGLSRRALQFRSRPLHERQLPYTV